MSYYPTRIRKLREFRQKIKNDTQCEICQEPNSNLLDFAHYDRSTKLTGFGKTRSIDFLKDELTKGRFLCVWCHRLETRAEQDVIMSLKSYEYDDVVVHNGKRCTGPMCKGKVRHLDNFYVSKGKRKSRCKNCCLYVDRIKRVKAKQYVDCRKIDTGKCQLCSVKVVKENTCCFDWDHNDMKTKKTEIGKMISQGYNSETIEKEIAKCRLLCCKCHRLHTMKQLNHIDYDQPVITKLNVIKPAKLNIVTTKLNIR